MSQNATRPGTMRIVDALVYALAGVMLFIGASGASGSWWMWVLGIGAVGYAARIAFTDASYWRSSLVYFMAFFALVVMWLSLTSHG